jgi:hypothetical protein
MKEDPMKTECEEGELKPLRVDAASVDSRNPAENDTEHLTSGGSSRDQRATRVAEPKPVMLAPAPQILFDGDGNKSELRPVPGLTGYFATSDGEIYSNVCTKGCWMKRMLPKKDRDGYLVLEVSIDGGRKRRRVHRMVAATFLAPPTEDQNEIRHLDGNPANNRIENLVYGTHVENMSDRLTHGRNPVGERNGRALLTQKQVAEIRYLISLGTRRRTLALHYRVSLDALRDISNGRNWHGVKAANESDCAGVIAAIGALMSA